MLDQLDRQQRLTSNQIKIISAAILGDMLEFFDYFLIGFVLAFIVGPWKLSFGESTIILLTSGIGAIAGAFFFGWTADKWGRRPIFMVTVLTFSLGSGFMALTPEGNWVYLALFRFLVGFGVGGLYSVDLPLVQEFVPARYRGVVGGLVTVFIPIGTLLGSSLAAFLAPSIGWRGLFWIAMAPALLTLLVRAWVPESPRWLVRQGRNEQARKSIAWAMMISPNNVNLPSGYGTPAPRTKWGDLFHYKRSWAVSWLTNIGMQSCVYGLTLWGATLIAMLMNVSAAQASFYFIFVTLGGLAGRITWSFLSEKLGRRVCGTIIGFGAAITVVLTAVLHDQFIGGASVYWLGLIVTYFFADGGFAIVGPYSAEVWPAALRSSGMGSAYGIGGIGKIVGPMGLALVVGASNLVTPAASEQAIVPAYVYLACFALLAGVSYAVFGIETKGKTLEEVEKMLAESAGKEYKPSAGYEAAGH